MKQAKIFMYNHFAGILTEDEDGYALSAAYDLLSTRLAIPEDEDNEELALTLNGKKRKLRRKDFDHLLKSFKIDGKAVENVYFKFRKVLPEWSDFIDSSLLSEQMKEEYKLIIKRRAAILYE